MDVAGRRTISSIAIAGALVLTACTSAAPQTSASTVATSPSASPVAISMANARLCPVTTPDGRSPAGTYGNGRLRVGVWPHGVIAVGAAYVDPQGHVRMKFPWWRKVRGRLRITGERIDAPAPPLRSDVPHGYGPTGFQASGVTFPTEGCWRITGTAGGASLTFVTYVIKRV